PFERRHLSRLERILETAKIRTTTGANPSRERVTRFLASLEDFHRDNREELLDVYELLGGPHSPDRTLQSVLTRKLGDLDSIFERHPPPRAEDLPRYGKLGEYVTTIKAAAQGLDRDPRVLRGLTNLQGALEQAETSHYSGTLYTEAVENYRRALAEF